MTDPVRVLLEQGKKKRVVACAFDWPGWDRSARIGHDVLAVLDAYRPRYAQVAERAGLAAEFGAAGEFTVVERVEGIGMTDYYGLSGRAAAAERDPMTDAECERKVAAASRLEHFRRNRCCGVGRAQARPARRRPGQAADHPARERRGDR